MTPTATQLTRRANVTVALDVALPVGIIGLISLAIVAGWLLKRHKSRLGEGKSPHMHFDGIPHELTTKLLGAAGGLVYDCPHTPSPEQSRIDIISRSQTRISTDIPTPHLDPRYSLSTSLPTLPEPAAHSSHVHILPPTPPPSPPPTSRLCGLLPKLPRSRSAQDQPRGLGDGVVEKGDATGMTGSGSARGGWGLGGFAGKLRRGKMGRQSILPLAGRAGSDIEEIRSGAEAPYRPQFQPTAWERVMGV